LKYVCFASITTSSGSGFEAMLNSDLVLVVTACIKKERQTATVADCLLADGVWVSVHDSEDLKTHE
jgi:hypothetical protein